MKTDNKVYIRKGRIFYQNTDPTTSRFLPVPQGQKPPKMIKMENELGVKFEDDYKKLYLSGEIGQQRFAKRWRVNKWQIFDQGKNARRRSWTVMLGLPLMNQRFVSNEVKDKIFKNECEICGVNNVTLDKAHWIDYAQGGPSDSWNILKLCPNCHRKVDIDKDASIIQSMREIVLAKAVSKMAERDLSLKINRRRLLHLCSSIIYRSASRSDYKT